MRCLVLGGHGHLGSRAVCALARVPGVEVVVAGRNPRSAGELCLDLGRPETFEAVQGFDVVVNAACSRGAAPDALVAYCLTQDVTWLEVSSDRRVVARLLSLPPQAATTGRVVLGAGIFTGLSNLLGAAAVSGVAAAQELQLGVRSSPLSGCGAGTVRLMIDVLDTPACRIVDGAALLGPSIAAGPAWTIGEREEPSLLTSFAEPQMLASSLGVRNISMVMLPKPSWLASSFLLIPSWLVRSRLYRALLWCQLTLLRRVVLRERQTSVELFARARSGAQRCERRLFAADGMGAAGVAIAAMAALLGRKPPRRGVSCIDECLTLNEVVREMSSLDARCVTLSSGA